MIRDGVAVAVSDRLANSTLGRHIGRQWLRDQANFNGGKMKTTRRVIQVLVLVLGLAGAVAAFVSTPKLIRGPEGIVVGCPEVSDSRCTENTEAAVLRGGGVLVLAIAAFAGVAVIFKD